MDISLKAQYKDGLLLRKLQNNGVGLCQSCGGHNHITYFPVGFEAVVCSAPWDSEPRPLPEGWERYTIHRNSVKIDADVFLNYQCLVTDNKYPMKGCPPDTVNLPPPLTPQTIVVPNVVHGYFSHLYANYNSVRNLGGGLISFGQLDKFTVEEFIQVIKEAIGDKTVVFLIQTMYEPKFKEIFFERMKMKCLHKTPLFNNRSHERDDPYLKVFVIKAGE